MRGESGFTRTEALVVVVIVTLILAAAAVTFSPGGEMWRARESARRADCRRRLHEIGKALAQWRTDHDGNSPETIEYEFKQNMICNAWGRLFSEGYCSDEDLYFCPNTRKRIRLHDIGSNPTEMMWTQNAAALYNLLGAGGDFAADYDPGYVFLLNSSYNYDNARIAKDSAAGRVIAGDGGERQWMRNAEVESLDSGRRWESDGVEPNHDSRASCCGGGNVLFFDGAVVPAGAYMNYKRWIPHQTDALLAGSTTSLETEPDRDDAVPGPDRPCLGGRYDWVRHGVAQNTRVEEDDLPNGSLEHDDVYAIEGVSGNPDVPDQWWLLSEFQFETGILVGGKDWVTDGHGRITDTKGSTDGMVRVAKSKIDASIQPMRPYRPGTGWPDDARTGDACRFGVPTDTHSAGDIWTY